jgi:Domain of unknown function (DUF6754)
MGRAARCAIMTALLAICVLAVLPALAQTEETPPVEPAAEVPVADPPEAEAALPETPTELPVFARIVVEDNPYDAGEAIQIRWLLAESPGVKLFGEVEPLDSGTFGNWLIEKTVEATDTCEEGKSKKKTGESEPTYVAEPVSGPKLTVSILRAPVKNGKPLEPYTVVGTTTVTGELTREEFRYSEGAKSVFLTTTKQRYKTAGKRMVTYRFWRSYIDKTAQYGHSYFYRIKISDASGSIFAHRTLPVAIGENRNKYDKEIDFGPVQASVNAIPGDPKKLEEIRTWLWSPVSPPGSVDATDNPSDSGGAVLIQWLPTEHDLDVEIRTDAEKAERPNPVTGYMIFRAELRGGKAEAYERIGTAGPGLNSNEHEKQQFKGVKLKTLVDPDVPQKAWDAEKCEWYSPSYSYIVAALTGDRFSFSDPSGGTTAKTQWFDAKRTSFLVITLLISFAIIWFIRSIRSGKKLFVRKIAGLDAIDEAIGRATEMGRPILFIPGIQDMNDVQTVSSVIILGRIAKTIAEYDTKLMVPTSRSLVMTTARETVKEAYLTAGRPDAYNDDMITYLTDEQFGYVAGVNGIMVREKPATCFFLGAFFAESLILAETGNSIGAIQIAGTAQPAQLPFFIAACDYTLIGEELFAASAYLSNDPMQLGSLKGQDMGKLIAMLAVLIGVVLATIAEIEGGATTARIFQIFRSLFEAV